MVETIRIVAFERDGVSVFIEMENRTAAECLAEVDAARAVLLRHVEAEKPAAAALPTLAEWCQANDVVEWDLRTWTTWFNCGGPVRRLPHDVFSELQGFDVADSILRMYLTHEAATAALRDALLRLGKIRGDE